MPGMKDSHTAAVMEDHAQNEAHRKAGNIRDVRMADEEGALEPFPVLLHLLEL